ncbi:MAG: hypothetical protein ACLGHD_01585 [Actinomycetes bacterium]
MIAATAPNVAYNEAQLEELLLELNRCAHDAEQLRAWAARTTVEIERLMAGESLMYVRLAGGDEHGDAIVLMLLDGVWERAL